MKTHILIAFLIITFIVIPAAMTVADDVPIFLKSGTLRPPAQPLLYKDFAPFAKSHVLVQVDRVPNLQQREALKARGIVLLNAVPKNAYVAFVENRSWKSDDAQSPFRYIKSLTIEDKTHPRVRTGDLDVHVVDPTGRAVFDVTCHDDVSSQGCRAALVATGAEVVSFVPSLNMFQVYVESDMWSDLAALEDVLYVAEPSPPFGPLNDKSRVAIGADIAHEPPYSVTGSSVRAMVYDGGIVLNVGGDAMHRDLKGRLVIGENDIPDLISHATHVSCSLAGTGEASDGRYMGMAPGVAQIVSMAYTSGSVFQPIFYNNPGDIERVYEQAVSQHGVQVGNQSIGSNIAANQYNCDWEGDYEGTAILLDSIVGGLFGPVVSVWANGNERGDGRCGTAYGTTGIPASAKNILSIGATNSNNDEMTSFSSWGPTDDGRIKPDIVAPGSSSGGLLGGIKSCTYGSFYIPMPGTSMASPIAAGAVALVLDYWNREVGTVDPPANLVKALMIHGARDLGNPGPDYIFGWGLVSVPDTLDRVAASHYHEFSVDQDQTFTLRLIGNGDPIKVTLVWSDVPGEPLSAKALVNDLNLSVAAPDGTTKLPWVLNPAQPAQPAGLGLDDINPVEQVWIAQAPAGTYAINVEGFNVPSGPQAAAIVFSGGDPCAVEEVCDNGIDDNCDGTIDEGCEGDDDDDDAADDDDDADDDSDDDDDQGGCCG